MWRWNKSNECDRNQIHVVALLVSSKILFRWQNAFHVDIRLEAYWSNGRETPVLFNNEQWGEVVQFLRIHPHGEVEVAEKNDQLC